MRHATKLRIYRQTKATELSLNPNKIFTTQILKRILEKKPITISDLQSIKGVGKTTIGRYGDDIIKLFNTPDVSEPLEIVSLTETQLSPEQQRVLCFAHEGHSVLMTGPGGVGKSFLIKLIKKICKKNGCNVQVCGTTGSASELLENAKTIHAWSGGRLMNKSVDETIAIVKKDKKAVARWKSVDVLVIDEISMLGKPQFEMLDAIGKHIRETNEPFGGIQVIGSGDFLQIPPVADPRIPESDKFAFESRLWSVLFPKENVIELTKVFRQNDATFRKILGQIRRGVISRNSYEILKKHLHRECDPSHNPTIITPKRGLCHTINREALSRLEGDAKVFVMSEHRDLRTFVPDIVINAEIRSLKKSAMEETIRLKVGSQVMCVVNLDLNGDKPIVNGSRGVVKSFVNESPLVEFQNGRISLMAPHKIMSETVEGLGISQVPLISAWAITTHKSQGVTLESAIIDAGSENFEYGQIYVALSRVKTLDGVYLTGLDPRKIKANPKVLEYYQSLK